MIPYIVTPFGKLPSFSLCVILGILLMFILVHINLKKSTLNYIQEENYIFPKMVISGLIGYIFAGFFDSLFKIRLYGSFKISGITFYGGLIGVIITLYLSLRITHKVTMFSSKKWFDFLTLPFIVFHICGRIGCFLGGCCYGKITTSCFGVVFPDNEIQNIYHHGTKCYPTQLFEAVALVFIFLIIFKRENKFSNYILLYSSARFLIEFFRGDQRGSISTFFSPAQVISIILFFVVVVYKIRKHKNSANVKTQTLFQKIK